MTATLPAGITDADVAELYQFARRHAASRALSHEERETLIDSATDAVMWAIQNYDPTKGKFSYWSQQVVRLSVSRATSRTIRSRKNKPVTLSLNAERRGPDPEEFGSLLAAPDHKTRGSQLLPTTINDLPEELQHTIRLHLVDGYSFRDCALLLGVCVESVRQRLHHAAEMLAPDAIKPRRGNGEKSFRRRPDKQPKSGI